MRSIIGLFRSFKTNHKNERVLAILFSYIQVHHQTFKKVQGSIILQQMKSNEFRVWKHYTEKHFKFSLHFSQLLKGEDVFFQKNLVTTHENVNLNLLRL
jgi:hypothetical protein